MRLRRSVPIAVLLVSMLALPVVASTPPPEVLEGTDTVSQAIAWSKFTSPSWRTRESVVLGRADAFADSLASGLLQGVLHAPLLLTAPDELDERVLVEIDRLEVQTVHILGGSSAISPAIEQQLETEGYIVRRYAGSDRIQTALAASKAHASFYEGEERHAVLARAFGDGSAGFADALGAGALAAHRGLPLLLTPSDSLHPDVKAYLEQQRIDVVYLAGGTAALSTAVEQQLTAMGIKAQRVRGDGRAGTAVAMNDVRNVGDGDAVILTDGFADDAWAAGFGAALSAVMFSEWECDSPEPLPGCGMGGPDWKAVLLSNGDALPEATVAYLEAQPADTRLICSPSARKAACDQAAAIIGEASS